MKTLALPVLIAATLSTASFAHAAKSGKIYTCEVNGDVIYTSRPSGNCESTDLPSIGKYSSRRYDAPEVTAPPPLQPQAEHKESKSAKKADTSKPKNNTAKAKTPTAPIRNAPVQAASSPAPAPKAPVSNSRRAILETELNNERNALSAAQKSLAQARAAKSGSIDHQQIKNLEGSVLDRQQNIQALQRELGRM